MSAPRDPFQYSIVRVLPRVERGECLNVGIVLLCRPRRFLGARIELDERRLAAFSPELDPATDPAPPRRHRADRRGRRHRGADRTPRTGRAIPLAGQSLEHDHPAERGPQRAVRRPAGGARPPGARRSSGRDSPAGQPRRAEAELGRGRDSSPIGFDEPLLGRGKGVDEGAHARRGRDLDAQAIAASARRRRCEGALRVARPRLRRRLARLGHQDAEARGGEPDGAVRRADASG